VDRQVVDLLLQAEVAGQLEVCFVPRIKLETAPRIAIRTGDKTSEFYSSGFEQPIFDDLFGAGVYLSSCSSGEDWQQRHDQQITRHENALAAIALNTKSFRHDPGYPRDFKTMFSCIAGQTVRLQIEDPFLASGERNRAALASFLSKIIELGVTITSVSLSWRPPRPAQSYGHSYNEERPEDQQRDLTRRLRDIGLEGNAVQMRPRTTRVGHFHDRVVTATIVGAETPTSYRWDISSGIDNLMERDRQCSVFLTQAA
jgi:hypothetical protein